MSAAEPPGDPPSHTPPDDPRLAATPGSQPPERDRPSKALRHQRILAQLEAAPTLRASDLSAALGVSGETIRRDLMELQKQGRIDRTFGGAARPLTTEPARSDRRQAMIAEREAIANAVSEIIQPGEVLMLGGGVTTLHIARVLAARNRDLTVITHDFAMAAALGANPSFRVLLCAGRLHAGESYLLGSQTIASLNGYEANRAIVGASGVAARGAYITDVEAGAVFAAMIERATETIVVADHSKFDQLAVVVFARWHSVDRLVTDRRPAGALATALRDAGTDVVVRA